MYHKFSAQNQKRSTKDNIISILSYTYPLTLKKIYNLLKKNYGFSESYQAVHKAVKQLLEDNILVRDDLMYKLNLDWVKDIHNHTEMIRVNYFSKKHTAIFDDDKEQIKVFIFNNWFDVEKYLYYLQKDFIKKSKDKQNICVHHNHEWRPLFYLRAEYNWMRQLKDEGHNVYTLCSGSTPIDKWAADFYASIGANIKLGQPCTHNCETMIFGDLVISIYVPSALINTLKKEFSNSKIDRLNLIELAEQVFESNHNIKVMINKDKLLADELKEKTINLF